MNKYFECLDCGFESKIYKYVLTETLIEQRCINCESKYILFHFAKIETKRLKKNDRLIQITG